MSEKIKSNKNTQQELAINVMAVDTNTVPTLAESEYNALENIYINCKDDNAVTLSRAITAIDDSTRDNDLRKSVLLLAIREHSLYKSLGCNTFEEYGHKFHDIEKSQLNKYCRIADKFITIETFENDSFRQVSAKGGSTDLSVIKANDFTVSALVDKFKKPFSMSAMNEMLTIGDDSAKRDILLRLINAGTIYSKSPASSGENSIRAILKREFTLAGLVKAKDDNKSVDSVDNNTENAGTVKTVSENADKFTDKDRLNMIVSLVSTVKNEELKAELLKTDIIKLCEVWSDDVE